MSTAGRQTPSTSEEPVGVLVSRASQQISELVREEMLLARSEMTEKGKRFGKGGGLFGAAGIVGILAAQALVATCIAALALALPLWAAALIVTVVLAAVAGMAALAGKKQVARAGTPAPEQTINSVKADVAEVKERVHR
ncbi:phage holin family protein [Streptomyces griseus]|uniref:Integral membrane protein n=1 Tax=Streptomyces griseus subsp. griseus (strain JCM 4626 / CBS 651.72 / NBRC 13350 / KCC S-0626 / ISP 5235) TaxID=455632 RepID=B1VNH7_STRGG|nr:MULTISPECIES: phage holin family protein [Streptomyces]MYR14185.1 phage holin family protein [Streptomyces sp. SID724]MYR47763.1 phage holin family protein [Streptomyces sp. SID4928]MBW3702633.1 phage holin family protein [Streptomyces griseus]NEB53314.1 phage holin family protein [Streptomyces griseus]SED83204.1 Putative Holin-X, holin superfamily III [Streptomyces griseus]